VQPGGERLLQANEEVPGQELAAVRVARELEVEAGRLGGGGAARLVREQKANGAGRAAGERGHRVARRGPVEVGGAEIGDAGHDEPRVAAADDGVLVEEDGEAEPAQLAHPGRSARVVL